MPIHSFWIRPILLAGLLAALGCASTSGKGGSPKGLEEEAEGNGTGDAAPNLTLSGFWDKKALKLSGLRGKVVLLDIWASWCAPCKDELPALDQLAKRFKSEGVDAEIVAVSIDEDRAAAEAFVRTKKNWSLTLAHDPEGAVPAQLQPPKMPTSYLIDRKGVLVQVNAGYEPGDVEKLEAKIRDLL
jgi:thiol-disulfide isomerase/thioredoxin